MSDNPGERPVKLIREAEILSVDFVDGAITTRIRGRTDEDGWQEYVIPGAMSSSWPKGSQGWP